ncbi:fumarylacetoacetate hydrolase family protein [uncultured Pseudomonas sp.]|uniref:2-keto-4-pentenoate hydratase n=1 Tax=uncultured Pseudomonas sp. TaxID=114707 RepID=UPI0025DB1C8D|nr:fumarylacetoacetate hydrolase family protein [uncultured Pseudomonas sp.]
MNPLDDLPGRLLHCADQAVALPAEQAPAGLDVTTGYRLQRSNLALRLARGERFSGWKVAFAGAAAQARFGLGEPVYGGLTEAMAVLPGAALDLAGLVDPRLEIEIAFIFARDLPPADYSDEQIIQAIGGLALAFEVADCRWAGWRFEAGAFLADNAAAGRYCLSAALPFSASRHQALDYALTRDGVALGRGQTGDAADSALPITCWLVRRLLADKQPVRAGQVVLTGALLAPLAIEPGHFRFTLAGRALELDFVSREVSAKEDA